MQINHGVLKFFARLEKKRNLLYRKGMLQYRGDVCRIRPEYRVSCNFGVGDNRAVFCGIMVKMSTVSMKIRNRLITWTLYMGLGK